MSDNLSYLFIAFLISWIVIGFYLWTLGRQLKSLRDEVDALTDERDELRPDIAYRGEIERPAVGSPRT